MEEKTLFEKTGSFLRHTLRERTKIKQNKPYNLVNLKKLMLDICLQLLFNSDQNAFPCSSILKSKENYVLIDTLRRVIYSYIQYHSHSKYTFNLQ